MYPAGVGACGTDQANCKCWTCRDGACAAAQANVDQSTAGLYLTQAACSADPNKKCGWKYSCDAVTDPTSPDYGYQCRLFENGKWATQGECQCVSPLDTSKKAQTAVTFNSSVGPDCACGYDSTFTGTPLFKTLDACKTDTRGFMCGWGYNCSTASTQGIRGLTDSAATPSTVSGAPNLQYALVAGGQALYSANMAYAMFITVDGVITIRGNDGSIRFQSNIYNDTGSSLVPVRTGTKVPALQTAYIRMVGGNLVFTNFLGASYFTTGFASTNAVTSNFFTVDDDGVGRVYKQTGTTVTAAGTLPADASYMTSPNLTALWSTDSVLLPGMRLYAWNSTLDSQSTKLLETPGSRGFGSTLGVRVQVDTVSSKLVLTNNGTNLVTLSKAMTAAVAGYAWMVLTPTGSVILYAASTTTATPTATVLLNSTSSTIDPTIRVQLDTDNTLRVIQGTTSTLQIF